jgi:hypothetical protein
MATDSTTLISIEKIVSQFLFNYGKSTEDYTQYLGLACNAVQDFNLYDGNYPTTAKVTLNTTLKCIDMPEDMQTFIDLVTPLNGQWWSFTEKALMVNTTTFTGFTEGRDENQGEGVTVDQPKVTGYGAKGGWNKFRFTLDWVARRIYVDGTYEPTDYFVLIYASSGIKTSAETKIPSFLIPVIDAYLLWRETYWIDSKMRFVEIRKADYWQEKMKVRNLINAMSYSQWRDLILSTTTPTIQR